MIYETYAKNIFSTLNVPVRLLKNDKIVEKFENHQIDVDVALSAYDKFKFEKKCASFVVTQNFLYYAKLKINKTPYSLVLGPAFYIFPSDDIIKAVLYDLCMPAKDFKLLEEYFSGITAIDLRTFLNFVILLNSVINGEELDFQSLILQGDVHFFDYMQKTLPEKRKYINYAEREDAEKLRELISFYVKNGMVEEIEKYYGQSDTKYVGKMASSPVRQARNTFIVTASLFSRAAMEGGLDIVSALSMSDIYIQKVETLSDYYAILALQSEMVVEFAKAVAEIKTKGTSGNFVSSIRSYIFNHIEERIFVDDIAKELFINKSYLTTKFKSLTGKTLVEYITELKVNEAKRLLKLTDKSLSEISEQLAFSSQSYFQNVFKKQTGMTPVDFREKQ